MKKAEETSEVGFVTAVKGFLLTLDGLPSVKLNDLIVSEKGLRAYISGLSATMVEALLLDHGEVVPGEAFKPMKQPLSLPVGDYLLGRAITPLGGSIDGKLISEADRAKASVWELERDAPGISKRKFISEQFDTGIAVIDTLIPLGKGQRELILGDARSGKTAFIIDLLINQKQQKRICVYGAIGKPVNGVKTLMSVLEENKARDHTVVVASFSSDPSPLQFLTPKTALTIAEWFASQGKDVLLVLDDLGNHAKLYREISLLSQRFPGREAYPGDIFYQHAHLVERAGNFASGGSITALPIIELDLNDFTSFIPTNLMSMTDGHLLFRSSLLNQGRRPAIDISLSVTRVGQQTQNRVQNALSTKIKQVLAQAERLATVSGFGGELPLFTQQILRQRSLIQELLKQATLVYLPKDLQVVMLCLPFTKFFSDKEASFVSTQRDNLLKALTTDADLVKLVGAVKDLKSEQEVIAQLDKMETKFRQITGTLDDGSDKLVDKETWLPKF